MKLSYNVSKHIHIDMKYTDFMVKSVNVDTNEVIFKEFINVNKFGDIACAWLYANRQFRKLLQNVLNDSLCHDFKWVNDDCFMYTKDDNGSRCNVMCYMMGFV